MKIDLTPKLNHIETLRERRTNLHAGTCPTTFSFLMTFLEKMAFEAQNSAQTFPPAPSFEYSQSIYSGLVDSLTEEEKEQFKEVGIEFHEQVNSSSRVRMVFTSES